MKKHKPDAGTPADSFPRNDTGNAARFLKAHGHNLRYCKQLDSWFVWDGQRWKRDDSEQVVDLAKRLGEEALGQNLAQQAAVAKELYRDQDDASLKAKIQALQSEQRWLVRCGDAKSITNMLKLARSGRSIVVDAGDLDNRPLLLNVQNGTLDLQTGKLREHRQADLLTEVLAINYDQSARCHRWEKFLDEIFSGDSELIQFIQRWCGYCLTGDVGEQKVLMLTGAGSNGKSVFVELLRELLGPMAGKAAPDLFVTDSFGSRHPTELADLRGKRLVLASETEQGRKLRSCLLKELTGGEVIKARRMREDFFSFQPTAKFILSTNHRPEVEDAGDGLWRRLLVVETKARFGNGDDAERLGWAEGTYQPKDAGLLDALKSELPGILAWAVRGCLQWQSGGLSEPASVQREAARYREDEDTLGQFVAERCTTGPGLRVRASDMLSEYNVWLQANGYKPVTTKGLASQLKARGFERMRSNGAVYSGICLRRVASICA